MDPEQMLTRATVELEAAEAELRVAQQRVEELRTIQQGIQLAIQRYGHAVALPTPTLEDTAHVPSQAGTVVKRYTTLQPVPVFPRR